MFIRLNTVSQPGWMGFLLTISRALLPGSIFVHLYLGHPNPDPKSWATSPSLIGTQSVLINPGPGGAWPNYFYRGRVPLTHALLSNSDSLDPVDVLPLLERKLQFRCQRFDGSVVNATDLSLSGAITIEIAGRNVTQTPGIHEFPIYKPWKIMGKGTLGRNGHYLLPRRSAPTAYMLANTEQDREH